MPNEIDGRFLIFIGLNYLFNNRYRCIIFFHSMFELKIGVFDNVTIELLSLCKKFLTFWMDFWSN